MDCACGDEHAAVVVNNASDINSANACVLRVASENDVYKGNVLLTELLVLRLMAGDFGTEYTNMVLTVIIFS